MAGNDYQIDFSAADPTFYPRTFPELISNLPTGRASDPIIGATDGSSVESLAPANLALGQIVPFEFRISAGNVETDSDTVTVTAGWESVTTNGGLFGYDGNLGVIAAFVDASDSNTSGDTDAFVSNFSWALVGTEIQGTFDISNLDAGEEIVVEAWVVLQDEIPGGTTGNVQSRLVSAKTSGINQATISTGNQTIPLLRVKDFFSNQADLTVDVVNDSTQVNLGEQFTYTIVASNNSDVVANQVVLTDNLDSQVKFIGANIIDTEGAITTVSHDGTANGGNLTGNLGFLNPGEEVSIEVKVEVLDIADTLGTSNLSNTVSITSINDDGNLSNNTSTKLIDVLEVNNNQTTTDHTNALGAFIVNETGQIEYDYLYDGGWFQGELAVFSLTGMEAYEYGSLDYLQEAVNRAVSNSNQGRILTSDRNEGARFDFTVDWEKDFNHGNYQGSKVVTMNPGDEVGFMLLQNTTFDNIHNNPTSTRQWGKKVLFSTDNNQLVAVDGNGTLAFEDVTVDDNADRDYNDFVFQATGLTGNTTNMDEVVNPTRDWRTTDMGQQLIKYTSGDRIFNEGVFEVDATGEVIVDFLYDGGWYQGEVGIFSLDGMDTYNVNSHAFATEALNRALSNSQQGYVVTQDSSEAAKYHSFFQWERDFNQGKYLGRQIFQMNPGDLFGLVLIPNSTLEDSLLSSNNDPQKQPLFSVSSVNTNDNVQIGTVYDGVEGAIIGWEDVPRHGGSNQDYNDIVLAIEGADAIGISPIEDLIYQNRSWLNVKVGQDIVGYFNNANVG
ncbi:MAG: hypothetical protein Tsb0014_14360 [Pleurocapsa sp.]